MIKIYFGVRIDISGNYTPNIIEAKEIIDNYDKYKENIMQIRWKGIHGVLTIKYLVYKLTIKEENLFHQFHIHTNTIKSILSIDVNATTVNPDVPFWGDFQDYDNNYLTFDYEYLASEAAAQYPAIRICHFGDKRFHNSNGEYLYISKEPYLKQMLILPRQEYMEQMIACIKQFFDYRRLVETEEEWDKYYKSWEIEVLALEKEVLARRGKV
jgi:hypothetical protein